VSTRNTPSKLLGGIIEDGPIHREAVARIPAFGHVPGEFLDRHALGSTVQERDLGPGFLSPRHRSDDGRQGNDRNRKHVRPQERIDECRLATLELSDHHHVEELIGKLLQKRMRPLGDRGARSFVAERGQGAERLLEFLPDLRVGGLSHRRSSYLSLLGRSYQPTWADQASSIASVRRPDGSIRSSGFPLPGRLCRGWPVSAGISSIGVVDVILIPGFWLNAASWDGVVPALEAAGHRVRALTLPGLASIDDDRAGIESR
jgi:hypothetical protein